jgi:hypothetical protein
MRNIGRLTLTSSCTSSPSFLRSKTRPATLRSLSNHVCHIPDPQVFTWTCKKLPFEEWETGVNLGQGLSVCAATTWNPLPGLYLHSPVKTPKKDEEDIPIQRHCLPSWYQSTSVSQSRSYGQAMRELWYVNTEADFVQRGENSLIVKGDTSCTKHH